jgi:Icc protein
MKVLYHAPAPVAQGLKTGLAACVTMFELAVCDKAAERLLGARTIASPDPDPTWSDMTAPESHTAENHSPATLVQLSDLHLRPGEDDGPALRLERAVQRVAALQPQPHAVLLSGDIADTPSSAAYAQAHELLSPLGVPLYAIPGNHDDRDLVRARFGPAPAPAGAPVCFAVDCGPLRLVGCDSTRAGDDAGALGGEQLGWLEQTLGQAPGKPTLLALHHPPVLTGVRVMDAIALDAEDRVALEALLAAHRQVLAITCGHVHTTMTTAFAGRPLLICPSTNSTIRLDLRPRDDLPFVASDGPVGFAVHTLVEGRLVSHVQALSQGRDLRSPDP